MDATEAETDSPARADFIERNLANLAVMSRTRRGVSDTSSSADKPKLVTEGEELAERTERNHVAALEFAWRHRADDFSDPRRVEAFVLTVADQIGDGLLQPGQSRWRTWETSYPSTHPDDLDSDMRTFYAEFARRLSDSEDDPLRTAAWVEQEVDGRIHPFADGCGRTAKTLSAFVLARAGRELPRYRSREEYYGRINENPDDWYEHYTTYFADPA